MLFLMLSLRPMITLRPPDDFIGSVEINLSALRRGELHNAWMNLDYVKTRKIHLQLQKTMVSSPLLRKVLTRLTSFERSWQEGDLTKQGISVEQILGEVPWVVKKGTINAALSHIKSLVKAKSVEWNQDALRRVERILASQKMLPTCREMLPSTYMHL